MIEHDVLELSLSEAARLVSTKEVSPVELVDACLGRIDSVNDKLAAYIEVYRLFDFVRAISLNSELRRPAGCGCSGSVCGGRSSLGFGIRRRRV